MKKSLKCVFVADPFDDNRVEIIQRTLGNKKSFKAIAKSDPEQTFRYPRGTATIDTLRDADEWHPTVQGALDDLPLDTWLNHHEPNCAPEIFEAVRAKQAAELERLEDWMSFATHIVDGEMGHLLKFRRVRSAQS